MKDAPSSNCRIEDCGQPTELFMCPLCVSSLQQYIDKIPGYLEELPTAIYKLDNVRPMATEGGNGTKSAGSKAPINLDAYQIRENLLTVNADANTYATDPFAAGVFEMIIRWVNSAELILSGPETEYVNHAEIKGKVHEAAPPMPTRQLVPWLRLHAKLSINGQNIRDWARRGKLRPVARKPSPTYWPHEVIQAHHETRNE